MHANNASLFDDSDDDAELDEPIIKRLRTAEGYTQVMLIGYLATV